MFSKVLSDLLSQFFYSPIHCDQATLDCFLSLEHTSLPPAQTSHFFFIFFKALLHGF